MPAALIISISTFAIFLLAIIIPILPVLTALSIYLFLTIAKMATSNPPAAVACTPANSPQLPDVSDGDSDTDEADVRCTSNASTETAGSLGAS